MVLHILRAGVSVSESALTLVGQQLLYEVLDGEVEVGGPADLAQEDVLVEGELVPGEGRATSEQLVCEDTQGPPVHTLPVPGLQDDLGRHVLRGPTLGPAPLLSLHVTGETQVCYHCVAGLVKQNVLWLQVPDISQMSTQNTWGGGQQLTDNL